MFVLSINKKAGEAVGFILRELLIFFMIKCWVFILEKRKAEFSIVYSWENVYVLGDIDEGLEA